MGMAPVVISVFFLGGVQLLFLGVLGEYIGEILARLKNRPLVVEKERINFGDGEENDEDFGTSRQLKEYVCRQINYFFPDSKEVHYGNEKS